MKTQQQIPHRSHLDPLNNISVENLLHFKSNFDVINNKKEKSKKQDINIIRQTRKMIKGLGEKERFKKAKNHFYDALYYKRPRLETFSDIDNQWVSKIQMIQQSSIRDTFLYIISYLFMYIVILQTDSNFSVKVSLQAIILFILWCDLLLQNYHKTHQKINMTPKVEIRFYLKVVVLIALVVDYIIFLCFYAEGVRPVRPFRILRGFLPIFYDAITRKNFYAFASAAKDIFVFLIFYALVIMAFAIIGNQFIVVDPSQQLNQYTQNYGQLGKYIFILYVMSTYDSYPDNQLPAIRNQPLIYILFIIFIFFNVLLFVTIPTTIIFNSFKETRSRIILLDQIKQQHSLILAFVSLGQNNFNINIQKLIRFLLYMYKNKIRYLNYITEIVLKMDENNNGSIQVNQFMQICKIMQERDSMMPPLMHDWKPWINFRNYMNETCHLTKFFKNWWTKLGIVILILFTFLNGFLFIYTDIKAFQTLDNILAGIFVLQIVLRIISLGFQDFFGDRWNTLDFYLVMIAGILNCLPDGQIPTHIDVLIKMFRAYRITALFKLLSNNPKLRLSNTIYRKIKQLLGQTAIIIPILMRLFPLFMIIYYFLGIIGMEAFYNIQKIPPSQSPYSFYSQFSHFKTFIGTQIVFVQVLVEAGWSMVAYDHAYRSYGYFGFVMMYFVACHVVIVLILTSLFKGIIWQVYLAVDDQYKQSLIKQLMIQDQEESMMLKKQQYEDIHDKIQAKQLILPTTVVKRQMFQNKIDDQIFKKLKIIYLKAKQTQQFNYLKSKERIMLVPHLMNDRGVDLKDIRYVQNSSSEDTLQDLYQKIMQNNLKNFSNLEYVEQEDFQQKMQNLLSKLILNPKVHYSQAVVYPKHFVQYLTKTLKRVNYNTPLIGFDINNDILSNNNAQSLKFHTYELNVLLQIQKSARQQKLQIAEHMVSQGILTEEDIKQEFAKKLKKESYSIEVNHVLRKVFLQGTNQDLIKKFQIQYFSNIYGQSFRQINKVTIEPLLRYEAMLTYSLRNMFRYSGIKTNDFFQMLVNIQNSCSNKLLKKGSLFKFVYQLDSLSDTWFTIQFSHQRQTIVHFIKTGIWLYNKNQIQKQIYHGKDIFNWDLSGFSDKKPCQKFMKLFYQSFQTLGLSQINQKAFFDTNPQDTIYDLFFFFMDTQMKVPTTLKKQRLKISKIMLVVLSKQQERQQGQRIPYSLTDIVEQDQQDQNDKLYQFKLDESQNQTFQKLKKLSVLDRERIVESEGLPYAYIINLMTQMKEILQCHKQTLIHQAQNVLNQQFDQVFDEERITNSSRRSKAVIKVKSTGDLDEEKASSKNLKI